MTRGTFLRSTVLPTCSTTNASSGMRQSARPRERAFGASEKNARSTPRSEEHTSELQSPCNLVCRLLLEKKKGGVRSEQHTSELQSPCNLVCRLLLDNKKRIQHGIEQTPTVQPLHQMSNGRLTLTRDSER